MTIQIRPFLATDIVVSWLHKKQNSQDMKLPYLAVLLQSYNEREKDPYNLVRIQ